MTLLPVWEQTRITVPPQQGWLPLELGTLCWVPGCGERGEGGSHHIVRRSHTGGPVDFVAIDGIVLYNRMKVCFQHHLALTDNKALAHYLTGEGYVWCTVHPGYPGVISRTTTNPKTGTPYYIVGKLEAKNVGG